MKIDLRTNYWRASRHLSVGLLLVAPLWIFYVVFAYRLNQGLGGDLRTGIDYLFTTTLGMMSLPLETSFILPGIALVATFTQKERLARVKECKGHFWPLMLVESLIYAAVFGKLVGNLSDVFLQGGTTAQQLWGSLVINLGSGPYEELVFRLFILGVLTFVLQRYIFSTALVLGVGIMASAASFAMFHYLSLFGEQFAWPTFVFRMVAGVVFSFVFLARGYGIVAWTHSFYNVFLMFR